MRLNEQDADEIKIKAQERIKYLKYMMTMIKERIKFNHNDTVRINSIKIIGDAINRSKKIRDTNYHLQIKKKHKMKYTQITI